MNRQIVKFVKEACRRYQLEAYFIPDNGVYTLTKRGRAVQNFNQEQFFQIPRAHRMKEYYGLIAGLTHNLGEGTVKEQIFLPRKFGIKIA